ncbi:MAG: hypothetical protein V1822_04165 [Candidatus Micrarchaeota archaeon]
MARKKIIVVCDQRFAGDYELGLARGAKKWDSRPYYLVNKVFADRRRFHLVPKEFHELGPGFLEQTKTEQTTIVAHLDQTRIPQGISSQLQKAGALNAHVTDVSKRRIERIVCDMGGLPLLIDAYPQYRGEVVIKSDLNAGDPTGRGYEFVSGDSAGPCVLSDPQKVVQISVRSGFVGEKPFDRMDRFVFFLGEVVICSFYSTERIIKRNTSVWQYYRDASKLGQDLGGSRRVCLNEVGAYYRHLSDSEKANLEFVTQLAGLMRLDIGSVDTITSSDGNFYVLDVNKTPWERGIPRFFLKIFNRLFG